MRWTAKYWSWYKKKKIILVEIHDGPRVHRFSNVAEKVRTAAMAFGVATAEAVKVQRALGKALKDVASLIPKEKL